MKWTTAWVALSLFVFGCGGAPSNSSPDDRPDGYAGDVRLICMSPVWSGAFESEDEMIEMMDANASSGQERGRQVGSYLNDNLRTDEGRSLLENMFRGGGAGALSAARGQTGDSGDCPSMEFMTRLEAASAAQHSQDDDEILDTPTGREMLCTDTCSTASDGECDDGGPGAEYDTCDIGTDCDDCGQR